MAPTAFLSSFTALLLHTAIAARTCCLRSQDALLAPRPTLSYPPLDGNLKGSADTIVTRVLTSAFNHSLDSRHGATANQPARLNLSATLHTARASRCLRIDLRASQPRYRATNVANL